MNGWVGGWVYSCGWEHFARVCGAVTCTLVERGELPPMGGCVRVSCAIRVDVAQAGGVVTSLWWGLVALLAPPKEACITVRPVAIHAPRTPLL